MSKTTIFLMVVVLTFSLTGCGPRAAEIEKEKNSDLAMEFMGHLHEENYKYAFYMFSEDLKKELPQDMLQATWQSLASIGGEHVADKVMSATKDGENWKVEVSSKFSELEYVCAVVIGPYGKVTGFWVQPAGSDYSLPEYVDAGKVMVKQVMVGTGEHKLSGEIVRPKEDGTYPGIVLVHGSGPQDMDTTVGPNKPFKDLAYGLAERGLVVLRYDKRTKAYPKDLASRNDYTVKDETVNDAASAVGLLRQSAYVDPENVYVLGHSLGGMVGPRILKAAPDAAGLVMVAAPARKLQAALIEQVDYLLDSNKENVGEAELVQIEEMRKVAERIQAGDYDKNTPPEELLGTPPSYWDDLNAYDQVATAKTIERPILILQGERDYNSTMEDFATWKKALGWKKNVTTKSYPGLNHLMIHGEGKPLPAEYFQAGNVDEAVVDDIAEWVKKQSAK